MEEYDKYATEYRNMVEELDDRIVRLSNDDKSFEIKAGYPLELAEKAKTLFENSQPEEKTKLLKLLVANLEINQKRLHFNLLKPFDMLIEPLQNGNWLPLADTFRTTLMSYDADKLEEVKVILYQQERSING